MLPCHMYTIDQTVPHALPGGYNIDFRTFLQQVLKTNGTYEQTEIYFWCYWTLFYGGRFTPGQSTRV